VIIIREERFNIENQILRILKNDSVGMMNNRKAKLVQVLDYIFIESFNNQCHLSAKNNIHSQLSFFKHTDKDGGIYRININHNKASLNIFTLMIILDESINDYIVLIQDIKDSAFDIIRDNSGKFGLIQIKQHSHYEYNHSMKLHDEFIDDEYDEIKWHPIHFNHGHESIEVFLAKLIIDKCDRLGIKIYKQHNKEKNTWEYIDFSKETC
jgi:hypothetical protein